MLGLAASPIAAGTPAEKPDGSRVNIMGTVVEPTASEFTLDFGKGSIIVEMDERDWYG